MPRPEWHPTQTTANPSPHHLPGRSILPCFPARGMASSIFTTRSLADHTLMGNSAFGASMSRIPHAACPCLRWGPSIRNKCSHCPCLSSGFVFATVRHQPSVTYHHTHTLLSRLFLVGLGHWSLSSEFNLLLSLSWPLA